MADFSRQIEALKDFKDTTIMTDLKSEDTPMHKGGKIVQDLRTHCVNLRRAVNEEPDLERRAANTTELNGLYQTIFREISMTERTAATGRAMTERSQLLSRAVLVVVNQMLRLYATEQNWDKGPEGLINWSWGAELKRKRDGDADNNAYQMVKSKWR